MSTFRNASTETRQHDTLCIMYQPQTPTDVRNRESGPVTVPGQHDQRPAGPAPLRVIGGSPSDDEIAAMTVAVMVWLSGIAATEPSGSANTWRDRHYRAPSRWRSSRLNDRSGRADVIESTGAPRGAQESGGMALWYVRRGGRSDRW
jgi:hypothetical protein